ncbi:hypothetical protein SGRIM119S_07414 [Streptomyces griseorubiginosus]
MGGVARQFLGEGVEVVDDRGGVAGQCRDPLDLGTGVERLGQFVAVDGVHDRQTGPEVVELPHHQVLPDPRHVPGLRPGGLGQVAEVQPGDVVHEPVGLARGGERGVVPQGEVVGAQRAVGLDALAPLLLQLGDAVVRVDRRLGHDQPSAQAPAGAAAPLVLLAVAGVDDVLGEQQLPGDREPVEVGRLGVLEDHGPAELEPREVPLPGFREQVQAPRPGLQPAVDLRGLHGVGGGDLPVPQARDRPAAPGRAQTARDVGGTGQGPGARRGHSAVRPIWAFSRIPTASGTRMAIE